MRRPFNGTFPVTQVFDDARYRASYTKFGLKGHNGYDYGTPAWTPILAPHSGKILEATFDASGYGNYVKIDDGTQGSVLAHLAKISVALGAEVAEGQLIGYSGNTGNSTGPHLHWGYYRHPRNRSNGFAGFIDQDPYLKSAPKPQPAPDPEGSVSHVPTAWTDQTKIPFMGELGIMELGAVRSELLDKRKDVSQLKVALRAETERANQLMQDLKLCQALNNTPPKPAGSPTPAPEPGDDPNSILTTIANLLAKYLGRKT